MLKITVDLSCHYPYDIIDEDGDHMVCTREDLIGLRDQLNAMFPPEPVKVPAKGKAGQNVGTTRFFTDMQDDTEHPFRITDNWTQNRLWYSANELHKLYTELQAHFGNNQNSTNPKQVDTPISWEARRWEAMLAVLGSISRHEALHNQTARLSMEIADALIARYRAEPNGGDA